MNMYQEHVMDHFKRPRNSGLLKNPTIEFHDENPICGDKTTITLIVDEKGVITKARHETTGCAVSQAAASMLFEELEGKTLTEAAHIDKQEILAVFGSELTVSRVKCALLALTALKKAIVEQHKGKDHA